MNQLLSWIVDNRANIALLAPFALTALAVICRAFGFSRASQWLSAVSIDLQKLSYLVGPVLRPRSGITPQPFQDCPSTKNGHQCMRFAGHEGAHSATLFVQWDDRGTTVVDPEEAKPETPERKALPCSTTVAFQTSEAKTRKPSSRARRTHRPTLLCGLGTRRRGTGLWRAKALREATRKALQGRGSLRALLPQVASERERCRCTPKAPRGGSGSEPRALLCGVGQRAERRSA